MEWSSKSATNAYLDALKLCSKCKKECNSCETQTPQSNEFISALAAGMSSKLIVEITSDVSSSTIALAAAARQTGGKLVCILPEPKLNKSQKAIKDSGLSEMVEFKTGDPVEILLDYENIDFSLVDCKADDYKKLLENLDVNLKRSVVVANNLLGGEKGFGGCLKGVENKTEVRSMKHPIGVGMEVTMIGKSNNIGRSKSGGYNMRAERKRGIVKKTDKSKWVFEVDEKSGEEHIFRMPRS
ncbi:hypothetical protein BUALT_Bualt19G0003000 [Buddleja alternifolia]|uniref:S-adenosyl-L-methionine-dependent methyltransferase n=1 Tax=Buddleja alternifolia TaxID=168488 RepID=A0AAV6W0K1_9LAMI|nr:hypothetical protein BUALT_Bualt19G0003000 [Buddleja alternifolia]